MEAAPPADHPLHRQPKITRASITFEAMRSPGALTLRTIFRDETTVPHLEHAVTWLVEGSEPSQITASLRGAFIDSLVIKCAEMGWSGLDKASQSDLRKWGEHATLLHLLRCLAAGTFHVDVPSCAGDRERAVSVVDDAVVREPAA